MEIEYNGEYMFNTNGIDKIPIKVNVMSTGSRLQDDKNVQITQNGTTVIQPDSTYDGIKKVTVETNVESDVKVQDSKEVTITQNGNDTVIPDTGYNGIASVFITTQVPDPPSQDVKNVTCTENKTYTIIPDSPYTTMKSVDVMVNTPVINVQDHKDVTVTENNTVVTINPDAGYNALGYVKVTPNIPTSTFVPIRLYSTQNVRFDLEGNVDTFNGSMTIRGNSTAVCNLMSNHREFLLILNKSSSSTSVSGVYKGINETNYTDAVLKCILGNDKSTVFDFAVIEVFESNTGVHKTHFLFPEGYFDISAFE